MADSSLGGDGGGNPTEAEQRRAEHRDAAQLGPVDIGGTDKLRLPLTNNRYITL